MFIFVYMSVFLVCVKHDVLRLLRKELILGDNLKRKHHFSYFLKTKLTVKCHTVADIGEVWTRIALSRSEISCSVLLKSSHLTFT